MVHVIPDSLKITPADPYTTDKLTATTHIAGDWFNVNCGGLGGYTRTYIHLLRRNVTKGETWVQAQKVSTYDCYSQCCMDFGIITGAAEYGYHVINFDALKPAPVGIYEFMAVDDEDFKKQSYQADRVAKFTLEVTPDPTVVIPPVITPGGGGITTTECASGDYMCLYKDYIPYAIGAIILVLLLTGGKKK